MAKKQRIEFNQLEAGYQFPPSRYQLDASIVDTYRKAVADTSHLSQDTRLVPPTAIAAHAMAALAQGISLPPGTIHVSQELEFIDTVNINDHLTSYATVSRKQSRGKLRLLAVALTVCKQNQQAVITGKSTFILPEQGDGQ